MARNPVLRRIQASNARRRYNLRSKLRRGGFSSKVHLLKEKYEGGVITASSNSTSAGVLNCQLSNLTNFPSFKNMYDLYKIVAWKVTLIPQWNTAQIGLSGSSVAGSTSGLPMLFIAPNRSPYSVAPTTAADAINDDGVRIIRLSRPVSMYLKYPKPLFQADVATEMTTFPIGLFNNNVQPWLSTGGNNQLVDQSGTFHNGFRYWLDNTNFAGNATVRVFHTLYLKFKEQD